MANWAETAYAIEGPKETLQTIYEAIMHHDVEEGSSPNWEGNVLKALKPEWNSEGVSIRGFLCEDEPWWDEKGSLRFYATEAWGVTEFDEELKKIFPDIKVYWISDETGCEYFETNDRDKKYFKSRFFLVCSFDSEYYEDGGFETEEAVYDYIREISKGKVRSKKEAEQFNDKQGESSDDFVYVYSYNVV